MLTAVAVRAADILLADDRAEKATERLTLAYLGRMTVDPRYINEAITGGFAWGRAAPMDLERMYGDCVGQIDDHRVLVEAGLRRADDDTICRLLAARRALADLIGIVDNHAEGIF